jgi:hypothetical protein
VDVREQKPARAVVKFAPICSQETAKLMAQTGLRILNR